MVVWLGLWVEKESDEEHKPEYLSNLVGKARDMKLKAETGWWILMAGIMVEIIAAFGIGAWDVLEKWHSDRDRVKLEAKFKDRTITDDQKTKFMAALKDAPRGRVRVAMRYSAPVETMRYAGQICDLLRDAGYTLPPKWEFFIDFVPDFEQGANLQVFAKIRDHYPAFIPSLCHALTNIEPRATNLAIEPGRNGSFEVNSNEVVVFVFEKR
jgi:hypothetical protein